MKKQILTFMAIVVLAMTSCKQEELTAPTSELTSTEISQIKALGFGTDKAFKADGGYIVEGDIFLSQADLNRTFDGKLLRAGEAEQYRTTNLVTGLPRVITVSIAIGGTGTKGMPASYETALDEMIRRYNAENLRITFQKVASGGDIQFVKANGSYLASSGFPTSTGAPFNQVKVNSTAIGSGTSTTFINYVATIFAHEVGHCIGFRHTDYMDRSYSCGGATSNEGAGTVGAINIPGTPTTADPGSWMLACIGANQNRPFNNNDKTALNYLY